MVKKGDGRLVVWCGGRKTGNRISRARTGPPSISRDPKLQVENDRMELLAPHETNDYPQGGEFSASQTNRNHGTGSGTDLHRGQLAIAPCLCAIL